MLATRDCFKVTASWDSSRLTRTIIRWRSASVSLSVQLCQGCIFELLKVLIEMYHIKEMKFCFILKKVWNCPGSTAPLAARNRNDRRNNGLSRQIKRVASVFCSIVFILMHVYTKELFITNIQTSTPNIFHCVCCSTSIEQSFKLSECLKIAHARMNFVCSCSHKCRGGVGLLQFGLPNFSQSTRHSCPVVKWSYILKH